MIMHEQNEGITPNPRELLIALLESDYTTEERRAYAQRGKEGSVLADFLSRVVSIEDINARLMSEECLQLGNSVAQTLESAAITSSFKSIIVSYAIRAYTHQSKVNELVSPHRLGFLGDEGLNGEGIYDPAQAKAIESRALRGFLQGITDTHVLMPDNDSPRPYIFDPKGYAQAMDAFDAWSLDYSSTYGEDAFTGVESNAHLSMVHVMSKEEADESGWADILDRLRQLRGDEGRTE